jgi:hypothetical protein
MTSSTTRSFRRRFDGLPSALQALARKQYRLWRDDPHHPSLHFKRVGEYWSVRIGAGLRALSREKNGVLYWFWIGPHDEYLRLIRSP